MIAKLDQIEAEAQTGDLLFFSGRSVWSWLIRIRSNSRWSHVGFACRDSSGCLCVVESVEGHGVRKVPFAVWTLWKGDIGLYRISEFHRARGTDRMAVDQAITRIGQQYASPWQFVRSFSLLWSRVSHLLKRPADQDDSRFFCSELVAWAFQQAGMLFVEDPARIKPGDIASDSRFELVMEHIHEDDSLIG